MRNKELAHPDDALKSSSSFEASFLVDHQPKADAPAAPSNGNFNMDYKDSPTSDKCRDNLLEINEVVDTNHSNGLKENAPLKSTKLIIKTKKRIVMDTKSPKLKSVTAVEDQSSARGDLKRREPHQVLKVPEGDEDTGRSISLRLQHSYSDRRISDAAYTGEKFYKAKTDSEGCDSDMEENTSAVNDHHDLETDVPEASSDAVRRTRSIKMKATSREPNSVNRSFKVRKGHALVRISRNAENSSMELSNQLLQGSRSTRNRHSGYIDNEPSSSTRRKSNYSVRKLSWLMLSEHEEGYRYIPQLGDEVVYLRQVMPDFS